MNGSPDTLTILVVDDDPSALRRHEGFLEGGGYRVITAKDGREGLRRVLADGPLMIVTERSMPEIDGLELCRALRGHEAIPFAYVIVLTAKDATPEQVAEAFEAGADDHLAKPVTRRTLLSRVHAGVRIVKMHQTIEQRSRELHRANAEMAVAQNQIGDANARLQRLVVTDELTGLLNRREAMNRLAAAWAASTRRQTPLACIAIDIDQFKIFNDTHGHAVGDAVLKGVAKTLAASVRTEESVCRLGGEEFLVLCPHASAPNAFMAAERFRAAVEKTVVSAMGLELRVTVSLGVAQRSDSMRDPDALLGAADRALYEAKHSGRNRTTVAPELSQGCDAVASRTASVPAPRATVFKSGACRGRVLVIDPDPNSRAEHLRTLGADGETVSSVGDVAEALRLLDEIRPDVIVLSVPSATDPHTPAIIQLKAHVAIQHIPILVLTSESGIEALAGVVDPAVDEYLCIPVGPQELAWRVRSMLRVQREIAVVNEVRGAQSRALGILAEFTGIIATFASLDSILERMMAAMAELTGCRRIAVLLPDPSRKFLVVGHHMGVLEPAALAVRASISGTTVGRVFEARSPAVLDQEDDLALGVGEVDRPLLAVLPTLVLPLSSVDSAVGVAVVSGRGHGRTFSALELEYARLISGIAAACVADCMNRHARDDAYDSIVVGLAKLAEHRDGDTGRHLDRVTHFSLVLARELRRAAHFEHLISDEFLRDLKRAVPLHDIGKVAVPDHILLKPGPLDEAEMNVMRSHASVGARTLKSLVDRAPGNRFLMMAEQIAGGHHEWFNGRGYPSRLAGDSVPLVARIVAVADVYDAITTKRPYKEAMPHDRAAAVILERCGTQFDPDVVEAFMRCESEFRRLANELADENTASVNVPAVPVPRLAAAPAGSVR